MEIGGMSLRAFEENHTLAELHELAALFSIQGDEREQRSREDRLRAQAEANRRGS
jgi:hypothetical protein